MLRDGLVVAWHRVMRWLLVCLACLACSVLLFACEDDPDLQSDGCPTRRPSGTCEIVPTAGLCFYPSDGGRILCDCDEAGVDWFCTPENAGIDAATATGT